VPGPDIVLLFVAAGYGLISGFADGGSLLGSFTSGRVITPRAASLLLLAALLGPPLVGTQVAQTVAYGIIDLPGQGAAGFVLIVAMSILVVLGSWSLRVPTSMTLALAGAMVGWALAGGQTAIHWAGVGRVILGMPCSVLLGVLVSFLLYRALRRLLTPVPYARALSLARAQYVTAALEAVAYGANDMEKTVGLVAVSAALAGQHGEVGGWMPILLAFLSFLVGTLLGGWGLARRIGFGVFHVRPVEALSQQLGSGLIVSVLSLAGAPISSTQTINASLVGVGVGVRATAVRWGVVREMLFSWLLTLPSALLGGLVLHAALRLSGALH
jgi:inorganic phosphate transporter, PiT family